jgi:hypothetical protein
MKKELQQKLFDKYPNLFENRHKSRRESCMSFGIEHGDGWYDLINNLCHEIDQHEKNVGNEKGFRHNKDYEPVKFDQVKEKFGGLRVYFSGGDEFVRGLTNMAEAISYSVCEDCGNKGKPNESGWIHTLCENCKIKTDQ